MTIRLGCLLVCLTAALSAATEAPPRLHHSIDDSETFRLKGQTHPALAKARDLGELPDSQPLSALAIHFALSASQQADLEKLRTQLQDPNSKQFHKFLTPEQYAARFGVNTADLAHITRWLEDAGFGNIEVARTRTWVKFSGNAGSVQSAFHTSLHRYAYKGQTHIANADEPSLPKALKGMVAGMLGFHDFQLKPHLHLRPQYSAASGDKALLPDDFATIYDLKPLYGEGYDGTNVKIAVLGQSDVNLADLEAFRRFAGLPPKDPTIVYAGPDPGIQDGDETESDLDLEWAGGLAKNASIQFVVGNPITGNGVLDALTYAVDQNLAPIISISYGSCETELPAAEFTTLSNILAQANAQGITVVAASGDSGPMGCDPVPPVTHGPAVDFPASSQYVTGIGGTSFEADGSSGSSQYYWSSTNNSYGGSALGYIGEQVWDEQYLDGLQLLASGGGASVLTSKPAWQSGTGVPADGARDVPDVAFSAAVYHDPYLMCASGSCAKGQFTAAGGTSAGTPGMAAIVALLIEKTGQPQGNINPRLYSISAGSPNAFHDVIAGDNSVVCPGGVSGCVASVLYGYSAGPGYDKSTGLGSIDAYNLVNAWPDFGVSVNPGSVTVQRGGSATASVSVSPVNGFSGNITLACSVGSGLTSVTCSVPNASNSSAPVTLTVTAGSTAQSPFGSLPSLDPRALWLTLAALLLATTVWLFGRKRSAHPLGISACGILLVVLVTTTSCGNGSSSGATAAAAPAPQNETGMVTITATSGGTVKSAPVTVTVPAP